MTAPLRYEYCLALKDAGYPQPEFAEGQVWYQSSLCTEVHITPQWMHNYTSSDRFRLLAQKARLIYSPGYKDLAAAANVVLPVMLTDEDLADIWLAQNRKQ